MRYVALFLEDQPKTIELTRSALKAQGFDTLIATNIKEASEMVERFLPHLLVIDVQLRDGENGLDFLEKIRSGPYWRIPAFVMSASKDASTVRRSISLDIDDYIIKPADLNSLVRKLSKLVAKLQGTPSYQVGAGKGVQDSVGGGTLEIEGAITGVSETGICVSSHMIASNPVDGIEFGADVFARIGIRPPLLRLMESQAEITRESGYPFRSYFHMRGLSDADRKQIERWILEKGLKVLP